MTIKAAYIKAPWQVEVRDIELPELGSDEILLKVDACGICGSDLTAIKERQREWGAFGHEIAGEVLQVGAHVNNVEVSQTVVLESSSYCGVCSLCRNGRVDLCRKAAKIWGRSAMGFNEEMIAPACCAVPYKNISPEIACMAEPAGVAVDMVQVANIELNDSVCIVGPGPIALMSIPLALRQGAGRLVCIGKESHGTRLELAKELGAEVATIGNDLGELDDLKDQFDHVLMTAPAKFIPDCFPFLRYGGEITYIGIGTGSGDITFDANNFHFRKLQLRASFASPGIFLPLVLDLFEKGILPGEKFISHRFNLGQMDEAFPVLKDTPNDVIKMVIKP